MNKDFIPYEKALALKELGFDDPCFGYYNYNGTYFFDYKPKTDDKNLTKASLYQQAFRWFREKHNLKSWVQEHIADTFIYEIRPHVLTYYKKGEIYVYANYEEAELACLKKLIEIIKSQNNAN